MTPIAAADSVLVIDLGRDLLPGEALHRHFARFSAESLLLNSTSRVVAGIAILRP